MYYKMGTNMDSGSNFVGYLHTVGKHSQDKLNFKQSDEGKLNCRCAVNAYSLHCGPLQTNFSLCRPWQRCEREKGYNLSLLGFFYTSLRKSFSQTLQHRSDSNRRRCGSWLAKPWSTFTTTQCTVKYMQELFPGRFLCNVKLRWAGG